jgi:phosphoribosylformimino-5-aminoimidazole carboxamide ribotide isomerase
VLKRYHGEGSSATFDLLPAIDILGGEVVRLRQGDFDRATAFSTDAVSVASTFVNAGTRWLHVVDLDGARAGQRRQRAIVRRVIESVGEGVGVQVAGGLRTRQAVDEALNDGATRVVLGTAALEDPALVRGVLEQHGADAIAVAVDVRDGLAVGDGWRDDAPGRRANELVAELADIGVTCFVVTAIERDGLLEGPNLTLLGGVVQQDRGRVIASGGISSIDDLRAVRDAGCAGAIVGRAIYEGRIDLHEALAAVGDSAAAEPDVSDPD